MSDSPIHRRLYAQQMLARAFVERDERLVSAFSRVPREDFAGPPPWYIRDQDGYRAMPSNDPLVLYQDVLVALDMARAVNNGSPALHVGLLHKRAFRKANMSCISVPAAGTIRPFWPNSSVPPAR
jgi:protein-L-isoaspartate(D-aspartate) O-methyltransferase